MTTRTAHGYAVDDFAKRKITGDQTESYVRNRLVAAGIPTEQPKMAEGLPTIEYTKHQIDLIGNGKILEVKGRNYKFDDVASFPFADMFIETQSGFLAKAKRPKFYINVSNPTGAIIALDVDETFDRWTVRRAPDRVRQTNQQMFIAQTKLWIDFDELVRRLAL